MGASVLMTDQVQAIFLKLQLFVVVNLPWERGNLRKLGADSTDSLPDEETKQKQSQSFM